MFSVPLLVTVTGPPFVVTRVPVRVKLFPLTETPPAPFVLTFPFARLVPVPLTCVIVEANKFPVVTLRALVTVKFPRRVVPPISPLCTISPVPAAKVRFPPPSIVLEKVMFWLAAAVVINTFPEIATAWANETGPPDVIWPASKLFPVPVWLKAPEEVKMIPEERVKSPAFAMAKGPEAVVVAFALKRKLVPVKLIPELEVVFSAPWKVVVPVPLLCVKNKALTP